MEILSEGLARSRTRARYSQDDVGAALGISRTMVSYWEAGRRSAQRPAAGRSGSALRLYSRRPA